MSLVVLLSNSQLTACFVLRLAMRSVQCSPTPLSPLQAVQELVAEKGVMGLYAGFLASALGSVKAAIHFSIFEQVGAETVLAPVPLSLHTHSTNSL